MKDKQVKKALYLLILFIPLLLNAQQYKVGGALSYNLRNKGIGIGLRGEIPIEAVTLLEGVSAVPRLLYYPSLNSYYEYYLGSDIHLGVYSYYRWNFYALVNLGYNGWINHADTLNRRGPKFSNVAFELGGGVNTRLWKCLYPFFELRNNFKWWEPSLQFGVMYAINCERRGQVPCSRIPKQPGEFFKEE